MIKTTRTKEQTTAVVPDCMTHVPETGTSFWSVCHGHKHCSSIYFRCKITTVLAFTLSVTVMLLTDLTSVPDDKSIGN